jgi:hypothetical protein
VVGDCCASSECGAGGSCIDNSCKACVSDSDCGGTGKCCGNRCKPGATCCGQSDCGAGTACILGACRACTGDDECGAGARCCGGSCKQGNCCASAECGNDICVDHAYASKNFVDNGTGQGLALGAQPTTAVQWCKH